MITFKITGGNGLFTVNGFGYETGDYEIKGNSQIVSIIPVVDNGDYLLNNVPIADITDSTDTPYTSVQALITDFNNWSIIGEGDSIYDGTEDLEATILAKDANALSDQQWWAKDTKSAYLAIDAANSLDGIAYWQNITVKYTSNPDGFEFPQDKTGVTLQAGKEDIFDAINTDVIIIDELIPQLVKSYGTLDESKFHSIKRAISSDISSGNTIGVSTTSMSITGNSRKGKVATRGFVNSINTTGIPYGETWLVNDSIYFHPTIKGQPTNIKPSVNIFPIAHITKVDAVFGVMYVDASSSNREDKSIQAVAFSRFYFTADEEILGTGTYFKTALDNRGVAAGLSLVTPNINDNQTLPFQLAGVNRDFISQIYIEPITFNQGERKGELKVEHTSNGSNQRQHIEVYEVLPDGTPIDSGVIDIDYSYLNSGAVTVGALGVKPIGVFSTDSQNVDANDDYQAECFAAISADYTITAGNRLRFHPLGEKVGTQGGNQVHSLFIGLGNSSFLNSPTVIKASDIIDDSDISLGKETVREALNNSLQAGGNWVDFDIAGALNLKNHKYKDGLYFGWPLVDTQDHLEPQLLGVPSDSIDRNLVTQTNNLSVVKMVHDIVTTKDGFLQQLALKIPVFDSDTFVRVTVVNITDGTTSIITPILKSTEYVTVVVVNNPKKLGYHFEVWLEVYNSTPANRITGGWDASTGVGIPNTGEFEIDVLDNPTRLAYSHIDLDGDDRISELQGVSVNSIITINETSNVDRLVELKVTAKDISNASYTIYTVELISNGSRDIRNNRTCTTNIDIPLAVATEFYREVDYYLGTTNQPSWATISSRLYFDGVKQPSVTDGYGISVVWQEAEVSLDWFIEGKSP